VGMVASFTVRWQWAAVSVRGHLLSAGTCGGSSSSVGGCCVCGCSRSWVGVVHGGSSLCIRGQFGRCIGGCSHWWGFVVSVGARVHGWASR
jgi:hypothetical protein